MSPRPQNTDPSKPCQTIPSFTTLEIIDAVREHGEEWPEPGQKPVKLPSITQYLEEFMTNYHNDKKNGGRRPSI